MVSIISRADWKNVQDTFVPKKLPRQTDSTKSTFTVPIGSAKKAEVTEFHPHAPGIKYL